MVQFYRHTFLGVAILLTLSQYAQARPAERAGEAHANQRMFRGRGRRRRTLRGSRKHIFTIEDEGLNQKRWLQDETEVQKDNKKQKDQTNPPTTSIAPSAPSYQPSAEPSSSKEKSNKDSDDETDFPTTALSPSIVPSAVSSARPSTVPSARPSTAPSPVPSSSPSKAPSIQPSVATSMAPSIQPSLAPSTSSSSSNPTTLPSSSPSKMEGDSPVPVPTMTPHPSSTPLDAVSVPPSSTPSTVPSIAPSTSLAPSTPAPSTRPTASVVPTPEPSTSSAPSAAPTETPTTAPSPAPTPTVPVETEAISVNLAPFSIDVETPSPETNVNRTALREALRQYLHDGFVETYSGDDPKVQSVVLQIDDSDARRLQAENGNVTTVSFTGYVNFTGSNIPEEEDVQDTQEWLLKSFLTSWQADRDSALEGVRISAINVDGSTSGNRDVGGIGGEDDDDGFNFAGVLGGLAACLVAMVGVVLFASYMGRRADRQRSHIVPPVDYMVDTREDDDGSEEDIPVSSFETPLKKKNTETLSPSSAAVVPTSTADVEEREFQAEPREKQEYREIQVQPHIRKEENEVKFARRDSSRSSPASDLDKMESVILTPSMGSEADSKTGSSVGPSRNTDAGEMPTPPKGFKKEFVAQNSYGKDSPSSSISELDSVANGPVPPDEKAGRSTGRVNVTPLLPPRVASPEHSIRSHDRDMDGGQRYRPATPKGVIVRTRVEDIEGRITPSRKDDDEASVDSMDPPHHLFGGSPPAVQRPTPSPPRKQQEDMASPLPPLPPSVSSKSLAKLLEKGSPLSSQKDIQFSPKSQQPSNLNKGDLLSEEKEEIQSPQREGLNVFVGDSGKDINSPSIAQSWSEGS